MGNIIQRCVFATRGYMVAANGVNTLIVTMRRRVVEGGQPRRIDTHRAIGERPRRHLVDNQDILVLFLILVQIGFYREDVVHIVAICVWFIFFAIFSCYVYSAYS